MRIFVKVKTKAKEEKIEKIDDTRFVVAVKEIPEKNKANFAVIRILAEHFNVPISFMRIVSGFSSHQKIFEISC